MDGSPQRIPLIARIKSTRRVPESFDLATPSPLSSHQLEVLEALKQGGRILLYHSSASSRLKPKYTLFYGDTEKTLKPNTVWALQRYLRLEEQTLTHSVWTTEEEDVEDWSGIWRCFSGS